MILRQILWWGPARNAGSCWGSSGGVLGCKQPPLAPRPMLMLNGRPRGTGNVMRLSAGGKNDLHTVSLASTAFTWRRRREREELLSRSTCRHCFSISRRDEGQVDIKDDEMNHEVLEGGSSDGEFFDTKYHYHHRIQDSDIGVKVNVGESVISLLHHLYHIPREKALAMVRSDSFLLVSDTAIQKTLYLLKDYQIAQERLLRMPWIMLQSADTLQGKFLLLQEPHLFDSISDGLGFCWFTQKQIKKYQHYFKQEAANFPHHPNRLYYLAERLEVPVAVLTEKVVKPRRVLTMDIKRLDHVIELFKRYNVRMEDVVSDMHVFIHNTKVSEERLRQATEAGCTPLKPWICHTAAHLFERYLERHISKRQVLGEGGSVEDYLSTRLQCPASEVQLALQRYSRLKGINPSKVKRVLDLMLAEGFTLQYIRTSLWVLQYSESRIRERIQEMKSLGHFPFPITVLYKKPRTYLNYVQRLKREMKELAKEEDKGLKERGLESGEGKEGEGR